MTKHTQHWKMCCSGWKDNACDLKMCQRMLMRFVATLFLSLYGKEISGERQGILCLMGATPWKPIFVWDDSKESTNLDGLLQWQLTVPYGRDLGDLALFSAELWWAPLHWSQRGAKGRVGSHFWLKLCVCTKPARSQIPFFIPEKVVFGRFEGRNLKNMLRSGHWNREKTFRNIIIQIIPISYT